MAGNKSITQKGNNMEFRRVFDTIPEQFDKYRPRYTKALFADLIDYAKIDQEKSVLELGPGTGQATEPILKTGCEYHGIELGENLSALMSRKYGDIPNFNIINDDFITHDFGDMKFDMIYSAATIQWIPEEIAFAKTYALLKPGGILAMMLTRGDYRTPNEELYQNIQKIYTAHFKPEVEYTNGAFKYTNAVNYGFMNFEKREYYGERIFNAEEYAAFCGTHCDHIVIPEPHKSKLIEGLKSCVSDAGNRIVFHDTYILYLTRKPLETE